MKIGTITVQNGNNYGASLQAFALIHYLRSQRIDANLIDYRNQDIENRLKEKTSLSVFDFRLSSIKKNLKLIFSELMFGTSAYSESKKEAFDAFHRKIFDTNNGPFYSSIDLLSLNDDYDGFICGSDQIWNRKITGLDDAFFLKFAQIGKKRIAYAPSLGSKSDHFSKDDFEEYQKKLRQLDYISVREENNREFIEAAAEKKCSVVVDPVLLLDTLEWETIIEETEPLLNSGYAVYYPVINQPELEKIALKRAQDMGLKLINPRLVPKYAKFKGYTAVPNRTVGPLEFVRLIHDSECVFTNSFHATVFSSLFNKELYVLKLDGENINRNNRIIEYLKMIDFYPCISAKDRLIHISKFDPEGMHARLAHKRQQSVDYLQNALK